MRRRLFLCLCDSAKPTQALARARHSAHALAVVRGPSSCGSRTCKMACTVFTAQLAFELCGLLVFVQVVTRNMVTTLIITLGCHALARPRALDESLPAPQPHVASLRPAVLGCLTVFRRLLLCPINHHLVVGGFSAIPAPSLRTLWPFWRSNTLSFFLSCSVYRVASLLPLLRLLSLLRASANSCASTGL